jgi:hypothetical protein
MTKTKAAEESSNKDCNKEIEELKSYKYLLGEFGIAMLTAVYRGAQDDESIMMLSGVPSACISGRMPILLNLELVSCIMDEQYSVTPKGKQFLKCINQL